MVDETKTRIRTLYWVLLPIQAAVSSELKNGFGDEPETANREIWWFDTRAIPTLIAANSTCAHELGAPISWSAFPAL